MDSSSEGICLRHPTKRYQIPWVAPKLRLVEQGFAAFFVIETIQRLSGFELHIDNETMIFLLLKTPILFHQSSRWTPRSA